jgi:hypothetical protein
MKLDKDSFLMNMNMVELDGKKVLVRPSQAESTKGKDVIIREEWPPSMIKPKSLKAGQWPKNEGGGGGSSSNTQRPPLTFSWPSIMKVGPASRVMKIGSFGIPNRTVRFPWVKPAHLQPRAHPANDLRLCHGETQKVGIIINKIISRCLTSRLGHQCLGCGDLGR